MSAIVRVAVLGGSGFVGRAITTHLSESGLEARSFSRREGFDLLDIDLAATQLREYRPTHVINCAAKVASLRYMARRPASVSDENCQLVLNFYRVVRMLEGTVAVNIVSNCVYPGSAGLLSESELWNGPPHPSVRSYASSRRLLLELAADNRLQHGITSLNLVVPNMYGPGDSTDPDRTHALNALVIKFTAAIRERAAKVEVWGSGRPVREWLFVHDLARLAGRVVRDGDGDPAPTNVAQNQGISIGVLAERIAGAAGFTGRIMFDESMPDGAPCKVMDDARFRARFPEFQFTPMEEALKVTLEYSRALPKPA